MILLNPKSHDRFYPDERSREVMLKTIEFFEAKGKARLKEDDHGAVWYQDFLDFVAEERIFATMCTPGGYGGDDTRWDTWRNCEFGEILGFFGLPYWYSWQVTVLGLGPIWMSGNEAVKQRTAQLLDDGAVFAFGLSEQAHGADLYSSEMTLEPTGDGSYKANGSKYYIGNANAAGLISTFGKLADTGEYCFFAVDPTRPGFDCKQNVVHSQNYVAEFELADYPYTARWRLEPGEHAFQARVPNTPIASNVVRIRVQ